MLAITDRYISLWEARRACCYGCNAQFENEPCEPNDCIIMQELNTLSTADVVPVVRCAECRMNVFCPLGQYLWNNGFCSNGERQTNGAKMNNDNGPSGRPAPTKET